THDLGVVAELCDDVAVMYAGRVVERAPVEALFTEPRHPYTRGLIASVPRLDTPSKARLDTIEGVVPALAELPQGCRFSNRCPHADDPCRAIAPPLEPSALRHDVACHHWRRLAA